ncbi:MAG: hypothetical protein LAO76_07095 [Acidobacteriia bacterium]|nr:hypothetical protein [Terriglobia bacterium]
MSLGLSELSDHTGSNRTKTRGAIHFHKLFNLASLGLRDSGLYVDRIIREFLKIGEAVAARWIQMPRGILLLQVVPGRLDSGAIYLYDRATQIFYLLGFDGPEDNLTPDEFDRLFEEYQLLRYAADPSLAQVRNVATPTRTCRSMITPRLTLADFCHLLGGRGLFRCAGGALKQLDFPWAGSA